MISFLAWKDNLFEIELFWMIKYILYYYFNINNYSKGMFKILLLISSIIYFIFSLFLFFLPEYSIEKAFVTQDNSSDKIFTRSFAMSLLIYTLVSFCAIYYNDLRFIKILLICLLPYHVMPIYYSFKNIKVFNDLWKWHLLWVLLIILSFVVNK